MRCNCEFSAVETGKIEIRNLCFFISGCILNSHSCIRIGKNTRFGPDVIIFDHDYRK